MKYARVYDNLPASIPPQRIFSFEYPTEADGQVVMADITARGPQGISLWLTTTPTREQWFITCCAPVGHPIESWKQWGNGKPWNMPDGNCRQFIATRMMAMVRAATTQRPEHQSWTKHYDDPKPVKDELGDMAAETEEFI